LPGFTALLDACVLHPAPVRDLLIETANAGIFRARWSDDIHEEWIRSVLANNKRATPDGLARTRALMDAAVPDCLVTNYRGLIPELRLPDPHDCHVLAAAIVGRADVIVTSNLRHFPAEVLDAYGLEAQHPDTFLMHQRDLAAEGFLQCARRIRRRLVNPRRTVEEYLASLRRCELALVADTLEKSKALL
jgi:predicted nucleic acid-binding protein